MLPCVAGHVGADAAGVVLSEAPHRSEETVLIVDVGTNAEIVLGNKERLLAASSPTGPAFEGAQIEAGQRAAPGAVERVRIDRETLEARVKVVGCDLWSDEEGFQEATAATGVTGICGSGIIEALAEMYLAGILLADGTIAGGAQARTARIVEEGRTFRYLLHPGEPEISIHQNDVRAIQLAKAALMAGARLLMDRFEVATVDRIVLTGAFGSHIDPLYAMVLGLIPDCRARQGERCGQRRGHGRADRAARLRGTRGDRDGGARHREGRDRRRARVPAPLRRRHGDPPRHRGLRPSAAARHAACRRGGSGLGGAAAEQAPEKALDHAKASGMEAFFLATNSLSASSMPGSMGGAS